MIGIPDPGYKVGDFVISKKTGALLRIKIVNNNQCQLGNDWQWSYSVDIIKYADNTKNAWYSPNEIEFAKVHYYKQDFDEILK